jgi:Flp pilus assembly protein TadD
MPAAARALVDDADKDVWSGVIDQVSNAVAKLRQATQIAPDSAEIWGKLADAYMLAAMGAPAADGPGLRARGFEAMNRALELRPGEHYALAAPALAQPVYRNWYNSENTYRGALKKAPGNPFLHVGLAYTLLQVGRAVDALEELDRARQIVPSSARIETLRLGGLWAAGKFDEADSAMDDALKLWPRHFGVWFTYLYYRMYNGRAGEAVSMIADVATRPIGIPEWNFDLVAAQAKALATGDPGDRKKGIEASMESAHRGTGFAENAAQFAGFLGEFDAAFAILGALYFNRGFAMPDSYFAQEQGMYSKQERHTYNLFVQPLKALRRDPRYSALTRELGLDDYWRRTSSRAQVAA